MYSTVEAAKSVGVSKNTLLRWLDEGLTEDVERDWRGWRVWRREDIARVKAFREAYHSEPQRRRRRRAVTRVEFARGAAASMARFGQGCLGRPEAVR
jgi:predicted site-specific integrase-resolvase